MNIRLAVVLAAIALTGCAIEAQGPAFRDVRQDVPPGQAHIYIFRDKVTYLAQAPYIRQADIVVDGGLVGHLQNGGYLSVNLTPGRHVVSASSANFRTIRSFWAAAPIDGYIEISDKTRMDGARMAVGALASAAVVRLSAIQSGEHGTALRQDELNGAMNAVSQDEAYSGPERVWEVDFPNKPDAQPRLEELRLSQ